MKIFKQSRQFITIGLISIVASSSANGQSKSPTKKDTVYSTIGNNPVIKDETGKVLTFKEMIALTKTGDYKVSKKLGSDKKPFLLVEKAPGFAPRPESVPVVVRPNKKQIRCLREFINNPQRQVFVTLDGWRGIFIK